MFRSLLEKWSSGSQVQLVFVGLFVLVGTAALHLLLSLVYQSRGATQGRLLAAALCLNQLVTCAQLFSVMEQVQGINWTDPFATSPAKESGCISECRASPIRDVC